MMAARRDYEDFIGKTSQDKNFAEDVTRPNKGSVSVTFNKPDNSKVNGMNGAKKGKKCQMLMSY